MCNESRCPGFEHLCHTPLPVVGNFLRASCSSCFPADKFNKNICHIVKCGGLVQAFLFSLSSNKESSPYSVAGNSSPHTSTRSHLQKDIFKILKNLLEQLSCFTLNSADDDPTYLKLKLELSIINQPTFACKLKCAIAQADL